MSVLSTSKNQNQERGLFEFTHGIDLDARMATQEVQVQKVWASTLAEIGVLKEEEAGNISSALDEALSQILKGEFDWRIEDEDIHMNLERFLVSQLGEVAKRIHIGRSRNDLVATTLRIYVKDSLEEVKSDLFKMIQEICKKAESFAHVIVPGMTHLQNGQPIRFAQVLAAHGWAFSRDLEKLSFAQSESMKALPLGSAALAGTTLKLDLHSLAKSLGFESGPLNSYDSVGDRDFLVDALYAFSRVGIHLSRMAEDFIFWSSTPVSLVRLPRNWSTGSSIMPNKRNPDVPELIRAKSSHLLAAVSNAQILLKGLPSSYNSDLHELKRVYMRALDELSKCLPVFAKFLSEIEVDSNQAQRLLEKGHLLATEVANALTQKGVPFRDAYAQTAALVETAENRGVSIENLDADTWARIAPELDSKQIQNFSFQSALEARSQMGGTALRSVLLGIESLRVKAEEKIRSKRAEEN